MIWALPVPPVVAVPAPGNVAVGPDAGAEYVMTALGTALPNWSAAWTASAVANALVTMADWPSPPVTLRAATAPAVLVRWNETGAAPVTVAAPVSFHLTNTAGTV